jgi:flavin-dependent dehydrogenase
MVKPGATFFTRDGDRHLRIRFEEGFDPAIPHAYNVRRDEFDALLLRRAAACGADVREGWKAVHPAWEGSRLIGVEARDGEDRPRSLRARVTLDASGQPAFLATRMGWKATYDGHRKLACASHFEGVDLPGGDEAGNITIVVTDAGWLWMIPFSDGTTSVGTVLDGGAWKRFEGDPAARFDAALAATPEAARRMAPAKRLRPFAALQNFSFGVSRIHGDGFVLLGDAAGFLDPIFSTGIFLGVAGAARAADDVALALRRSGRVDAADLAGTAGFVRDLHRLFFSLIGSFYDPHFLALFFQPRPALRIPEAVVSLLAGDVLRPDRRRLLLRFRALQGLARLQGLGARLGRPLVDPLGHTPAVAG